MTSFVEITVNDSMQSDYRYTLSAPAGAEYGDEFTPYLSPPEMLRMGVFEGKYLNDCQAEYPAIWFEDARLSKKPNETVNYFGVKSRQPLSVWRDKGWIYGPDPRGWFQWYCRYYQGRRIDDIDIIQIKRWKGFARHAGQIRANCEPGDVLCRPRQRQGLLQWAYDPFI